MVNESASSLRKPVFVLINLKAGGCDADLIETQLQTHAERAGVELEICRTSKGKRKKTRKAIEDGFCTLIAVGGDGTVSKVASEAVGKPVEIGIIPAGTANLLAEELGIPNDIGEATEAIFSRHRVRSLDGMKVGKHTMFSHVSMGTYSRIAAEGDEQAKRLFGKAFYLWRAFGELRDANRWQFHMEIDGIAVRRRSSLALIANICPMGVSGMNWGDHIEPDDGTIDVCLVRAVGLRDHLGLLASALRGRTAASRKIEYLRACDAITVRAADDLPVRGDGNIIGEGSVELRVIPKAVRILVPEHR